MFMPATYTKLKNGDWGVRFVGPKPKEGSQITVKKKDGSEKRETVEKVLWSDDSGQTHLLSVHAKGYKERGSYVCADCGKPGKLVQDLEDGLMKHYRCCDIPPGGY